MRSAWIAAGLAAGLAVTTPAGAETADKAPPVLGFSADRSDGETRITTPRAKPAAFDSFADRMDFIHDNLQLSLQRHVERIDGMMVPEGEEAVDVPHSRFRVAPFVRLEYESKAAVSLNPDFEAEVDLPNLKRYWRVFIESSRGDDLPGVDRSEKDQSAQVGVRNVHKYIRTDVGLKLKLVPVLFARAEWREDWSVRHTVVRPRQRIFYETDDGWGSLTDLTVHRWFGSRNTWYWQTVSGARIASEGTEGYDLEQSLKLGFVRQTLEGGHTWKSVVHSQDLARGHILRYSLFGNAHRGVNVITRHRLTYTYRRPLYKKWIYLEVSPGIVFQNEKDWDPVPQVTMGVDMLFWGSNKP